MKLEHAKGYLGTGCKARVERHVYPKWTDIKELDVALLHEYRSSSYSIRPILRPLYDLTKEIEVNGEKFVPIIELFKIRTQHLSDSIDKYYIENDTAILKLQENAYPDGKMSYCHFFEIDIEPEAVNFSLATEYYKPDTDGIWKEEFGFIGNEFNMLQKLYEWHFDIHGLIEKELAIDKNTIS